MPDHSWTVAETILFHLGGIRFLTMTAATDLVTMHATGLRFHLPRGIARHFITLVSIDLNARDLYDVTFSRMRGAQLLTVSSHQDVGASQLRALFTEVTGLDTTL